MPNNPTTALVKTVQSPALARVSNQLALTDKLLTKPEEPFLIPYRKGNKWGFCDRNKNIVIDCVYGEVRFPNEMYISWHEGYFVHNKKGNVIWQYKHWEDEAFITNGLAAVEDWNKWGFIDETGKAVTPIKYDYVSEFYEGLALVKFDNKSAFLNEKGEEILTFTNSQYNDVEPFSNGLSRVGLNEKYGFINKNRHEVIPLIYDNAGCCDHVVSFSEGMASVEIDDRWGFINLKGEQITPCVYERAEQFSDGMALVSRRLYCLKQVFIDLKGEEVIDLSKYDWAKSFSNELALVVKGSKFGYINKRGYEVIPLSFDYEGPWVKHVGNFYEDLAAVTLNGRWGYINRSGKEVTSIKYKYCQPFRRGLGFVTLDNYANGYIDTSGIEYWDD